jgi:hypothetical protein
LQPAVSQPDALQSDISQVNPAQQIHPALDQAQSGQGQPEPSHRDPFQSIQPKLEQSPQQNQAQTDETSPLQPPAEQLQPIHLRYI